jgi:plastocyanin
MAISERRRLPFTAITVSLVGIVTGLLLGRALLPSTATPPTAAPGSDEVYIKGNAFSAANITVPVGTTVVWTNQDRDTHTVTSTMRLFDSGGLYPFSHTFTEPGVYNYICTIHSSMRGKVTVL